MTFMMIAAITIGALILGGLAGFVAASLGRMAREADDAERAAWDRREAPVRIVESRG